MVGLIDGLVLLWMDCLSPLIFTFLLLKCNEYKLFMDFKLTFGFFACSVLAVYSVRVTEINTLLYCT